MLDVDVAVSRSLLSNVDSFTLYDNPLYCDCHLRWIVADRRYCFDVYNRRLLSDSRTRCAGPTLSAGLTLPEAFTVEDGDNATVCGPLVTALFDPVMYLPTGSTLRLECRVAELSPQSSVVWITPARRQRVLRIEHSPTDTVLVIHRLESRDAGTYHCVAVDSSTNISSTASTTLRLYNVHARVLPVFVGSSSAMITWSGTDSTLAAADYVIVHAPFPVRNHSDLAARKTGLGMLHLRPYLRKYTINDLRPGLTYEFCIMTEIGEGEWVTLHCTQLTTKPDVGGSSKMTAISWRFVAIVMMVMTTVVVVVLRCVCARRRGVYRMPGGMTSETCRRWSSTSLWHVVPLSQITSHWTDDDELSVITSRTSLIHAVAVK